MFNKKSLAWLLAVFLPLVMLLLAHRMIKLPTDPFWDPAEMFTNLAFGLALAFSLPYPYFFAALFLLVMGWIGYRIGLSVGRLFRLG